MSPATQVLPEDPPGTWRSALFPRDWIPADQESKRDPPQRFLPDFSYAGWHRGEQRPPYGAGIPTVVVDATVGDAATDATPAIQHAVDRACAARADAAALRTVRIPEGTYRLRVPATSRSILSVRCSRLVIRGDGPNRTRLLVDDPTRMRGVTAILVRGIGEFYDDGRARLIERDIEGPISSVSLRTSADLEQGDWVVVHGDNTEALREEHRMAATATETFWSPSRFPGFSFVRRVRETDGSTVRLDSPVPYRLRVRDRARLQTLSLGFLHDVGIESLSIGMVESMGQHRPEPNSDEDYRDDANPNTVGYQAEGSIAVQFSRVVDGWLYDVDSFQPDANTSGAHYLSNGVLLHEYSARITVEKCDWGRPQYRGEGGNGYAFQLRGGESLVIDSTATEDRHGFTINFAASGNVIRRSRSTNTRLGNETHRFLAIANLYDQMTLDRSWLQSINRGRSSGGAGFTGTQNVFWNTDGTAPHPLLEGCLVESAQFGWGYLIGSSSASGVPHRLCPTVTYPSTYYAGLDPGDPADYVEGEGLGATLHPASLHAEQLLRRCIREGISCTEW